MGDGSVDDRVVSSGRVGFSGLGLGRALRASVASSFRLMLERDSMGESSSSSAGGGRWALMWRMRGGPAKGGMLLLLVVVLQCSVVKPEVRLLDFSPPRTQLEAKPPASRRPFLLYYSFLVHTPDMSPVPRPVSPPALPTLP